MTEIEILKRADEIVRARMELPMTDTEREVLRDTITGLLWVRSDLVSAEATDLAAAKHRMTP